MDVKIPASEIEEHAWTIIRAGQAPTMTGLIDWIKKEVNDRENRAQPQSQMYRSHSVRDVGPSYDKTVAAVLWKLILARVMIPGRSSSVNSPLLAWDEMQLSDTAKALADPLPSDPGFLDKIRGAGLAALPMTYLMESIRCFSAGAHLGAMVMLGVAAEVVMDDFMEAFAASAFSSESLVADLKKKPTIKQRNDAFRRVFDPRVREIQDESGVPDAAHFIDGIFNVIRQDRNEAGHPTGRAFQADDVQGNLLLFRAFVQRCMRLTRWLDSKPRT